MSKRLPCGMTFQEYARNLRANMEEFCLEPFDVEWLICEMEQLSEELSSIKAHGYPEPSNELTDDEMYMKFLKQARVLHDDTDLFLEPIHSFNGVLDLWIVSSVKHGKKVGEGGTELEALRDAATSEEDKEFWKNIEEEKEVEEAFNREINEHRQARRRVRE